MTFSVSASAGSPGMRLGGHIYDATARGYRVGVTHLPVFFALQSLECEIQCFFDIGYRLRFCGALARYPWKSYNISRHPTFDIFFIPVQADSPARDPLHLSFFPIVFRPNSHEFGVHRKPNEYPGFLP